MHSLSYHKLPIRWPNHVQPQELPASALLPCPCVVRGTTKKVPLLPDVANPQNFPQERRRETGKTIIDKWWMVHVTNTNKKHRIQCGLSWLARNILGNFYSLVHEERAFWRAKTSYQYALCIIWARPLKDFTSTYMVEKMGFKVQWLVKTEYIAAWAKSVHPQNSTNRYPILGLGQGMHPASNTVDQFLDNQFVKFQRGQYNT